MKLHSSLLCVALVFTATAASAQDLCAEIEKLSASMSDFSDLRGERVDDETWQSTLTVSVFDGCTIGSFNDGLTFNCGKAFESDEALSAAHNEVADAIWACAQTNTRSYWEGKEGYGGRTWTFFFGEMQFTVSAETNIFTDEPTMRLLAFEA
jgi:hypothetical protein